MGKILAPDGSKNVAVGKVIALLAEEGDDIANLQAPAETESSSKTTQEVASTPGSSSSSPKPEQADTTHAVSPTRPHKTPAHSRPLFPSVLRLLSENDVHNPESIKGTGVRGMLTKGDVLAYLGKASGPLGSFKAALEAEEKKNEKNPSVGSEKKQTESPALLDGAALRRLIVTTMLDASIKARAVPGEIANGTLCQSKCC